MAKRATVLKVSGLRRAFGPNTIFDKFTLRLKAGEHVGIVGPSGAGKSTLFALLQRFYDAQRGRITIDGQDIARVTQESLRQMIAVVPQEAALFHRSVAENIRYGRPEASDEELLRAAIAARCDFIERMPEGNVNDSIDSTSGRRRIAFLISVLAFRL